MSELMHREVKRGPVLAGVLSLWAPGLGQVYLGQLRTGLAVTAASLAGLALLLSPLGYEPAGFVAGSVLFVAALLGGLSGAVLTAARQRKCIRRRYHRWWVLLFYGLATAAFATLLSETASTRTFSIPARSGAPTLLPGDRLVAELLTPGEARAKLRRGDIVIFRSPQTPGRVFIKRLIALPGDHIASRNGRLVINGEPLSIGPGGSFELGPVRYKVFFEQHRDGTSYPVSLSPTSANATLGDDVRTQTIATDHIFVLGDNRNNSLDSRHFGQVPMDHIVGRARFLFWAVDKGRIGKRLLQHQDARTTQDAA